jgi:hypothetical protein
MPREDFRALPERPIDALRRHETAIRLLEENAEDQNSVNEQLRNEVCLLRESILTDRVRWATLGKVGRFVWKSALYGGAAAAGWAWNHSDKIWSFFHQTDSRS